MKIAVIGSTGFTSPGSNAEMEMVKVLTDEGEVPVWRGEVSGRLIHFILRPGKVTSLPAHKLNYRRNFKALRELGITHIVATCAVGAINNTIRTGDFIVLDQFIDFMRKPLTFFDSDGFTNVDITDPFCPSIRNALIASVDKQGNEVIHTTGCYVGVEGPRYETAAEIKMYRILGGDVVGMTVVPEAIMARETGMCYGVLSYATNSGAGMEDEQIIRKNLLKVRMDKSDQIKEIIEGVLTMGVLENQEECRCTFSSSDIQFPSDIEV